MAWILIIHFNSVIRRGSVGLGKARHSEAWHGAALYGRARLGFRLSISRCGAVGPGVAVFGEGRSGVVWLGLSIFDFRARLGMAWSGRAQYGEA